MEDSSTSGKRRNNGGVRKVHCPKCRNLLIEPTDLPLYKCGVCSTVLQAKYYKGPPVQAIYDSLGSETTKSNASEDQSEANLSLLKSESEFVSKEELTDVITMDTNTLKNDVSENGSLHFDASSERSFDDGEISKYQVKGTDSVISSKQVEINPIMSGRDTLQTILGAGANEVDGSIQKSKLLSLEELEPTYGDMVGVYLMEGAYYEFQRSSATGSFTPAVSGREPPLIISPDDGCEVDLSIQINGSKLPQEKELADGEVGAHAMIAPSSEFERLTASDNIIPAISGRDYSLNISQREGAYEMHGSVHDSKMDLLEQKLAEGDAPGIHATASVPSGSEISASYFYPEQQHHESNRNGSEESGKQTIILSDQVEKSLFFETIELEHKSFPSTSDDSNPVENKFDEETGDLKGMHTGATTMEMNSAKEVILRYSEQGLPTENKKSDIQQNMHEIAIPSEQADKSLALEVGELECKLDLSISTIAESRDDTSQAKDGGCETDAPKDNAENMPIEEALSPKGDASSSNRSPDFSEQQRLVSENRRSLENKSMSLSMEARNNTGLGIHDMENMRTINIEKERLITLDDASVAKVRTVEIHPHDGSDGLDSPFNLHLNMMPTSRSHRSSGSFSSNDGEGAVALTRNMMNASQKQLRERKFHQRSYGMESMQSLASNQAEPSSRNDARSFQQNPLGMSGGSHYMQSWIENEKEELLRSLSRLSDSTEFDHERMELLNKIDELRNQILGFRSLSRGSNRIHYVESRARHSQPFISDLEDEYSLSYPTRPRHHYPSSSASKYTPNDSELLWTQSPRAMHHSPQRIAPPTPCIHRNCRACCHLCSNHSEGGVMPRGAQRHSHDMERTYRRERDYEFKRYCRPVLGAASFVFCNDCFQVLQMPEDVNFSTSRYKQLQCGSCMEILELTFLDKTHLIPYPPEARESARSNDYGKGRASYSEEGYSGSLRSYSGEGEYANYASRNSGVPTRRRGEIQIPLHSLMGYLSASELIYQEQD